MGRKKQEIEENGWNEIETEEEIEAKKQKEKERARRFMFADYDMDRWNEVNVYDLGIWMNLYTVYRPYWNVQHEIDATKNRKKSIETNGVHENGDHGTVTEDKANANGEIQGKNTKANGTKNGMKGGSRGQKLRKRRNSKKSKK